MKITGRISRVTVVRQADKYRRFAEQCRELAKPLSGRFKQTLEEMAEAWDDLARTEDKQNAPQEKSPGAMSDRG
jgi:hypothetical protein